MKKTIAILILLNLVLVSTVASIQGQATINILQNKLSISESVKKHVLSMLFLSNIKHQKKKVEIQAPQVIVKKNIITKKHITVPKKSTNGKLWKITFYTCSPSECLKSVGSKGYGRTASGISLIGKDITDRYCATDKSIPFGTKLLITFTTETMAKYSGIYVSVDRGGGIKGNRIDIFASESDRNFAKSLRSEICYSKNCSIIQKKGDG